MTQFAAATLRSLAFLTRLPPIGPAFHGPGRLGDDVAAFPVAGLLAALPSAAVLILASWFALSPFLCAGLSVTTAILVTGALHEDGLGDVADGLFGHARKERALAIMKDSRVGSYGALALVLSVLLRVGLLAGLLADIGSLRTALVVLVVAAVSRGAMAWLWASLPSADLQGLAATVGQPNRPDARRALLLGDGLYILGGLVAVGFGSTLMGFVIAGLALLYFRLFLAVRLGGQTGDCLGAAQQIVEILALLGLSLHIGLNFSALGLA